MTGNNAPDERCDILRFGKPGEKLELMRDLEELAKDCRRTADLSLPRCKTPEAREKNKPWRKFRRETGFPLFAVVLKIAQKNARSVLRGLAADILAHLWHPAAVDRLVEDITENDEKLLTSQVLGIFVNLAGIGNDVAVRGLISIWEYGWHYSVVRSLGACTSKRAEAFLLAQASEDEDPDIRGFCVAYLNSDISARKASLLLDKVKYGEAFERTVAIKKIMELHLTPLAGALRAVYYESDDPVVKEELREALRELDPSEV